MINTYIDKIMNSAVFAKSKRQRELLSYLIQQMRDGNGSRVKGYVIALELFKRSEDFDPSKDAIVRVEAGRLRHKLREYYETSGANDPVEIILPKGTYAIQVIDRDNCRNRDSRQLIKSSVMLSPPKLAIMPFVLIDMCDKDKNLVAEIADLVIFELVELDMIRVTSSNLSQMFNALSREQNVPLDAYYMFEASVQKAKEKLILMARIYSQFADAYVWHRRFSLSPKDKKFGVQMIANEVSKFLLDETSPINFDLFYQKDNLRVEVQQ